MPCRLCNDMRPHNPGSFFLQTDFSELCDAAKLGCPFCSVIRSGILQLVIGGDIVNIQIKSVRETGRAYTFLYVMLEFRAGRSTNLEFYASDTNVTKLWSHLPTAPHISTDSSSPECLNQARRWLDHCIQDHTHQRCPPAAEVALPTRVICVADDSIDPYLHESAEGEKGVWAALSYCWGKVRTLTTTTATLSERKAGFSLDTLPKTCRDAILVARKLSIPYLWIDSLCILQDSPTDWEREAARMCYIYENALVTLAGLHSPSSDTGLFLSSPYRRTAKLEAHINQIPVTIYARKTYDIGVLGIMHGHLQDSSGSLRGSGILETRGWTLQEVVLSPRILWFSSAELGWSCWSSTACECTPELTSKWLSGSAKRIKVSSSLLLNPKAATEYLATWRTLVPEFTKRILTVPTDRLPALSGLASALQTHLNSRYLAGLWESDLSKELIWASEWELVDANLDKSYLPLDDGYAPSWSWSSISGAVRFIDEVYTAHFRLTWQVVSVRFQHLGEDPFGRGQGSVTMEGDWLQVRWVDGFLVWDSPVCEGTSVETVLFCDRDDILMDPRAGIQDKKAVASKHLSFLVAGMLMKNSKSVNPDDPSLCCGLVLEYLPDKRVFKRLGFGEPHFNRSDMERRWDVWEKRYSRIKIDII